MVVDVDDAIEDRFGTERTVASGDTSVYLDRTAKRRVREFLGRRVYAKLEPLIDDAFMVEKDYQVPTAGHRTRLNLRPRTRRSGSHPQT